eukprot:TRINITY_DN2538_c0_g2_i1.p1 TRINITY_DN2538_c0_g2~~TRINITY_DN2538_c0_g2_i1.p1  ORF type:complete len:148 (+),score=19.21 TRINITY_DN2538_c0_g2_i1:428-871(+)
MVWMSLELKRLYPGFIITAPPAPWNERDQTFCKAMVDAGAMDYVAPQYYDGPDLNDPNYVIQNIQTWVSLVGAQRVMVGFGLDTAQYYMTLNQATTAWNGVVSRYPDIAGAFDFEINTGWVIALLTIGSLCVVLLTFVVLLGVSKSF